MTAPPTTTATAPPSLTKYGATSTVWPQHHSELNGQPATWDSISYDPNSAGRENIVSISQVGTKIKMSSGNFHSLPRGWVTGYVVNIPPGTPLRNAESVAMKELPGDAAVVATSTSQPDCVGQELDSAIVGEALSQLGANAKYIAVIYESGQGHQAAFDPTNVNTILISIGTGNAAADYQC